MEALEAGNKGPLAGNVPSVKFIFVSDKEKIAGLAEAARQDFVATACFIVVVCSDTKECKRAYEESAETYCHQQAGAAIENFWLKLTDLGMATCWVGSFSETTVKRLLGLPDTVMVEGIFPIGYEMGKTKQKPKQKLDACIFFDYWKNKYMKPIR